MRVRQYNVADLRLMTDIWNQVIEEGNVFPHDTFLLLNTAGYFFARQLFTAVAEDENGKLCGLYILQSNNLGRCKHIADALFAVDKEYRDKGVGEALVKNCMFKAASRGFRILRLSAVTGDDSEYIQIYEKLGFKQFGTLQGGFRLPDGSYGDLAQYYIELEEIPVVKPENGFPSLDPVKEDHSPEQGNRLIDPAYSGSQPFAFGEAARNAQAVNKEQGLSFMAAQQAGQMSGPMAGMQAGQMSGSMTGMQGAQMSGPMAGMQGAQMSGSMGAQQVRPKSKTISSINIVFGAGVLLLTIAAAVFLSSTWNSMANSTRAAALVVALMIVFGLSWLSGSVLKLKQTGFAFYTLGSLLTPILIAGMGALGLLGETLSFKGDNGFLVTAVAMLGFTAAAAVGAFIFRSGAYYGMIYLGFSWMVVFLAAQAGIPGGYHHEVNRIESVFIAIAILSLITRLIALTSFSEEIKFFRTYASIITFIATGAALIAAFDADMCVTAGIIISEVSFGIYAKKSEEGSWGLYALPFLSAAVMLSVMRFLTDYIRPSYASYEMVYVFFMVGMAVAIIIIHFLTRTDTPVSHVLIPVALMLFTVSDVYEDEWSLILLCFACAVMVGVYAFRKAGDKAERIILSIICGMSNYAGIVMLFDRIPNMDNIYKYIILCIVFDIMLAVFIGWRHFRNNDIALRVFSETTMILLILTGLFVYFDEYGRLSVESIDLRSFPLIAVSFGLFFTALLLLLSVFVNTKEPQKPNIMTVGMIAVVSMFSMLPVFAICSLTMGFEGSLAGLTACFIIAVLYILVSFAVAFIPFFRDGRGSGYSFSIKIISSVIQCIMLIVMIGLRKDLTYDVTIITAAVASGLTMYFTGFGFPAIIPVLVFLLEIINVFEVPDVISGSLQATLFCIIPILLSIIGRVFFRNEIISKKGLDYLAFMPALLLFNISDPADHTATLICIVLALMVGNFVGRLGIPDPMIFSVSGFLIALSIACSTKFVSLPDRIHTEFYLSIILLYVLSLRYLIKPADDKTLRMIWFIAVAAALVVEGISAAGSGDTMDLLIVGVSAIFIFVFSFIKKQKLWFFLGLASIIGIAIYLSATFWREVAWMIYLAIAGTILIAIAALNEWGRRHAREGEKRRFFEEWEW